MKLASSGNSKNKAPERCLYWPVLESSQQGEADLLRRASLTVLGLRMEDSEHVLSGRELA